MIQHEQVLITKNDGTVEPFDYAKLEASLRKAGAGTEVVAKITDHIAREIRAGMSTSIIFKHAFYLLNKFDRPASSRYSLRRAMIGFGPTGFPFEKFLAELFKAEGYETLTDQTLQGTCVGHEVDVVAWNEQKLVMVEAKFHNSSAEKSDLKVALYVKARYDDLIDQTFFYGHRRNLDEGWLVTNTKFSSNAIAYGECAGLKLISWNYPASGNLQDMIERTGLHPITSLTSLSMNEKQRLLESGVVLCKSVLENRKPLSALGFSPQKIDDVVAEAKNLVRQ